MRLFESRRPDGSARRPFIPHAAGAMAGSGASGLNCGAAARVAAGCALHAGAALSSGDRGLLDMLDAGPAGRLTVIELKADEDLHLSLQALDYWIRVRALNEDRRAAAQGGEAPPAFERQGYFDGWRSRRQHRNCYWPHRRCAFIRRMSGAEILFAAGGVGADCAERALAAGVEGGVQEAKQRRAPLNIFHC